MIRTFYNWLVSRGSVHT